MSHQVTLCPCRVVVRKMLLLPGLWAFKMELLCGVWLCGGCESVCALCAREHKGTGTPPCLWTSLPTFEQIQTPVTEVQWYMHPQT